METEPADVQTFVSLSGRTIQNLELALKILMQYVWVVVVVLGIPGNIISGFVATHAQNQKVSTCVYMLALSVCDACVLIQLAWQWPLTYYGIDEAELFLPREYIFKIAWYFEYTFAMASGTFLALMSCDRLIAVRFPLAARHLCDPARTKRIVVVSFIIIAVLNLNFFFTYQYVKDENTGSDILIISVPSQPVIEVLTSTFYIVFGTFLPFTIISICNIGILITVKQASQKRLKLDPCGNPSSKDRHQRETAHLTRILVFISAAYVLTTLPLRMQYFVVEIPDVAAMYDMSDPYWNLRYTLENASFGILWASNHAINFYLYVLAGGKKFRQDTTEVLRKLPCYVD